MKKFLRTYKEELIALPLLMLALWLLRMAVMAMFPDSALFDLPSEIESIVFAVLKLVAFTSFTWFGIRIVFPQVYKYLKEVFYEYFTAYADNVKIKVSLVIFFGFLFSLVFLSKGYSQESPSTRACLMQQLDKQLDVREATGQNDGAMVKQYLNSVGLSEGYPWCAAFCTYNLNSVNVDNPQSAWSPDWARVADRINKENGLPGDCFTIYSYRLRRVSHVGFIVGRSGDGYYVTIEGNTNNGGSRDGDGVYKRKRSPAKVHAVTRYIKET